MDIITHAITGAATGAMYGKPLFGAVAAVVPDCALLWRKGRLPYPPTLYKALHGLLAPFLAYGLWLAATGDGTTAQLLALAWLSHIFLDIPTHGAVWAPRLFWPCEKFRFTVFKEWEWFTASWWIGLFLAINWSAICLLKPLLPFIKDM